MGNKDIWYGECKIAFTSDDWKKKGNAHSLKFLEKINTDNMLMHEHEALVLTPEQQELYSLCNYKMTKDGTANFIDTYIPVKKDTGGYFGGIIINNDLQSENERARENLNLLLFFDATGNRHREHELLQTNRVPYNNRVILTE